MSYLTRWLTFVAVISALLYPEVHRWWRSTARLSGVIVKSECEQYAVPAGMGVGVFNEITAGFEFQHRVGPLGTFFTPEVNGAGGALWDYDNDGDLDIYMINAGRSPEAFGTFPEGTRTENRLFQQNADQTFTDVTQSSGLGDTGYGYGCAIADIDNDGDLDVYVTNFGQDKLYVNQGNGTFADITTEAGIVDQTWGMSATFFDYDRDGWLDLAVSNYVRDGLHNFSVACGYPDGRVSYCGPHKFQPEFTRLYHNEGSEGGATGTRFRDVTEAAGLLRTNGSGMGLVAADFTRDGWPDLFVANDEMPNRLWVNQHDGTFRDEGIGRGVAFNSEGKVQASMGVACGDFDNDGDLDLLATHLTSEYATLYANDGSGHFLDTSRSSKLIDATMHHTGWGTSFIDLDDDGDLDLPIANGLVVPCHLHFAPHGEEHFQRVQKHIPDPHAYWAAYADANKILLNQGDGSFKDASLQGGDFCRVLGSARALLHGDIDNDGDEDLLVTFCGEAARLYRNDVPKNGSWLKIRAIDPRYRRDAYGAEVTVVAGKQRLLRLVQPSTGYLSSQDPRVHVGLGLTARYDQILVLWPDGLRESFPGGDANRLVEIQRGTGQAEVTLPAKDNQS